MASKRAAVKLTANFEANLATIQTFWIDSDAQQAYDRLLDDLLRTVIPNLEHFPQVGRPFLARQAQSVESHAVIERLKARIGRGEIREYLTGDYLILYALIGDAVYLLSITHHRQLSFDIERFWPK
jgi:ParE toxin of type II toxin-antitoxin system, parDE